MSNIIGVLSTNVLGENIKEACRNEIRNYISNSADSNYSEYCDNEILISYDGGSVFTHSKNDKFIIMSGHALLDESDSYYRDLNLIVDASDKILMNEILGRSRGNFSAILWNGKTKTVQLISDCLASRPIYYYNKNDLFVFSSCLRHIKNIFNEIEIDSVGVLEEAVLSYPLSRRTPYNKVFAADAAEIIKFSPNGQSNEKYWDWYSENIDENIDMKDLSISILEEFVNGVKIRCKRYGADYCMLSGGMDSRLIAFYLSYLGNSPTTICFGDPRSSDQVIAKMVANLLPGKHVSKSLDAVAFASYGGTSSIASSIARNIEGYDKIVPIWSGDGGSVSLGGVYLTNEMCHLARCGEFKKAAEKFSSHGKSLSNRIVSSSVQSEGFVARSVQNEFEKYNIKRKEQIIYRFLMLNDQRRHLYDHYENYSNNKVEIITPFFDFSFIKEILKAPADFIVGHKLYTNIFNNVHENIRSVPWQTYPGHEKCPINLPDGCETQWGRKSLKKDREVNRNKCKKIFHFAIYKKWPHDILRKYPSLLLVMLSYFKLRRVDYVVNQIWSILKYI